MKEVEARWVRVGPRDRRAVYSFKKLAEKGRRQVQYSVVVKISLVVSRMPPTFPILPSTADKVGFLKCKPIKDTLLENFHWLLIAFKIQFLQEFAWCTWGAKIWLLRSSFSPYPEIIGCSSLCIFIWNGIPIPNLHKSVPATPRVLCTSPSLHKSRCFKTTCSHASVSIRLKGPLREGSVFPLLCPQGQQCFAHWGGPYRGWS